LRVSYGGLALEIHKPHAARSWREFFIELGTIVSGILIALALEQGVEWLREYHRASEARENIREEIAHNLGEMKARAMTEPCISKRLDEVTDLIARAGQPGPIWIGHPLLWLLRDSQFGTAAQAGHVSLFDSDEQASYAGIYAGFALYNQAETVEQKAWADLRTLEQHPAMSAVTDWQLRSAVQQARTARWTMETSLRLSVDRASQIGIGPGRIPKFTVQSMCIPLHTPRAEALKLIVAGRGGAAYDEP
jgi:hypothetical protein